MSSEKFETAIKKLEAIVEELESGKLSLDDTLKRYEEGVKLSALCSDILNKAEKKIEILSKKQDGQFDVEEFEPTETDDDERPAPRKRIRRAQNDDNVM
ncbi:MAG: exodeoxyribonuclease VII small subunit [Candidatus Omnitrophica bacterium]|nr:exodeoxyribonuclease VII small subunit [Candidatus Omnitrophota bacterium]